MSPASRLLKWYRAHGRDLPWRKTRDPYRVLVSEMMLQQTQVDRVKERYAQWLGLFPDWTTLAGASTAQVIEAWAGLGYNRRALMLRDIARVVVERGVPQTREGWMSIRGIGPYTSAAVSAFAQKQRVMPIDTNIRRVLGRFLLGVPFPLLKDDERIERAVESFLPKKGYYFDVPQAIFDLATAVCTKKPNCAECPLVKQCPVSKSFLADEIEIPKRSVLKAKERIHRNKKHPDRIFRGRILKLVREHGPIEEAVVGKRIDPLFSPGADQAWVTRMIDRLVKDRMIERTSDGRLTLSSL